MKKVNTYLTDINKNFNTGKTTEHSFRADLQQFVKAFDNNLQVINEPTRQACGAPDFIVQKRGIPIGYIEAKDITVDLDKIENGEQLTRYKNSLDNLILTNYIDFRFFKNGKKVAAITIAEAADKKIKFKSENFDKLLNLLQDFIAFQGPTIKTAKQLAGMMAQKAVLMRDVLENIANESTPNTLQQQLKAFKEVFLHDLDAKPFADVYAQTITYGLFVARLNDKTQGAFSRQMARELVSKNNPFLRKLFDYISGADLDERAIWIVDDLVNIFTHCDIKDLMDTYGNSEVIKDPFLHFYETFLTAYDKVNREKRGVYYTPQPVVKFIVQAVDDILQSDFNLAQGLADISKIKYEFTQEANGKKYKAETFKVQILDPATGTGTFLAETLQLIYQKFKNNQGIWSTYVDEALIPRLYGFELLTTPYVMCHLKLEMLLKETGYTQTTATPNRFKVYLSNALETHDIKAPPLFAQWLADEANAAKRVKHDTPIMVVLGNPPHSCISANGNLFGEEIDIYKYINGQHINEKKHWLNDDYVKFIRLAQTFIDKNNEGILAYINNNAFLDNPTFMGMRFSLLNSFDKIYIINLHGNARKKETTPDGSKDENVFNIMQGVSINIFVKTSNKKASLAKVFYTDVYGLREEKFNFLDKHFIKTTKWEEVKLNKDFYFFIPKDFSDKGDYEKGFSLPDIMPLYSTGIITMGDSFVVADSKDMLKERISNFLNTDIEESTLSKTYGLGKNYAPWILKNKGKLKVEDSKFITLDYRPFDKRIVYFDDKLVWRTRRKVMQHFIGKDNVGLVVPRICKGNNGFQHGLVSKNIIDVAFGDAFSGSGTYFFPLYTYSTQKDDFFTEREPNLNQEIIANIAKTIGLIFTTEKQDNTQTFAPIDVLDYIYGILHSNKYRTKYKEFLKIDFPRVPYPKNAKYFWQIAALGGKIRQAHLLQGADANSFITTYPIAGSDEVKSATYADGKVYINATQYFDNVPQSVWDFYIGGYQPTQKWLKDRKGTRLYFDDLTHYQKIVKALVVTVQYMQDIDKLIEL